MRNNSSTASATTQNGDSRPDHFQPEPSPTVTDTTTRRQFLRVVGTGATVTASSGLATAQETPVITIGNNYFDPIGLYVEPGTTVRFEVETGSHSATAYEDRIPSTTSPFDSGVISSGSFTHRFESPGTYDYYCIPHKSAGMVGRIVVGQAGGPAEETSIPAGTVPDSDEIMDRGAIPVREFEDGSSTGDGMMRRSGSGMMDGSPGAMMLIPLGIMTAFFGGIAGVIYWAMGRSSTQKSGDSPMSLLRQRYASGEIDDEEFQRRREQLHEDDDT